MPPLRRRKVVLLAAGSLILALAALLSPWWYEWKPNDPVGLNIYDVGYHPLWYQSAHGGEIIGFLYVGQLAVGLVVFALCFAAVRAR